MWVSVIGPFPSEEHATAVAEWKEIETHNPYFSPQWIVWCWSDVPERAKVHLHAQGLAPE